jgi:hypothetical protein
LAGEPALAFVSAISVAPAAGPAALTVTCFWATVAPDALIATSETA